MTELRGPRLVLRRAVADDVPCLVEIQSEPDVARWWSMPVAEEVAQTVSGEEGEVAFSILLDGELVGLIEYIEMGEPAFRHAGVDIFLSSRTHGRGLGREAVGLLVRHLIDDLGHHRLVIDPAAANEVAVRCYAAVGFRPVGVMRRYQRMDDGSYEDGLLMELVVGVDE